MSVTKTEVAAGFRVVQAVAEAIREAREIPSGHLYATLMPTGMSLQQYQSIIGTLLRIPAMMFHATEIGEMVFPGNGTVRVEILTD